MAITTNRTTVLLMDDELYNVQWIIDFLESEGYAVQCASNADEALEAIAKEVYRAAILDLNVPIHSRSIKGFPYENSVYQKYPGLFVALQARNRGYRDRQVVIYTVHRDEEVAAQADVLSCTYILKGRPLELKEELRSVLSYDPTEYQRASGPAG